MLSAENHIKYTSLSILYIELTLTHISFKEILWEKSKSGSKLISHWLCSHNSMKLFPAQIWIIAACFLSDVISHTLAASNMHRKSVSLTDYGFWKIAGETFGSKTTNSEKLKRNLKKIRRTVAGLSERWRWRDGFQNSGIPSQVSICNHISNQINK